jgi:hypothetical protein
MFYLSISYSGKLFYFKIVHCPYNCLFSNSSYGYNNVRAETINFFLKRIKMDMTSILISGAVGYFYHKHQAEVNTFVTKVWNDLMDDEEEPKTKKKQKKKEETITEE